MDAGQEGVEAQTDCGLQIRTSFALTRTEPGAQVHRLAEREPRQRGGLLGNRHCGTAKFRQGRQPSREGHVQDQRRIHGCKPQYFFNFCERTVSGLAITEKEC